MFLSIVHVLGWWFIFSNCDVNFCCISGVTW